MTDKNRFANIESQLIRKRAQIIDRRQEIENSLEDLLEPVPEMEESANRRSMVDRLEGLRKQLMKEMDATDIALGKIRANAYGICEGCGDEIPMERLRAIPWTPFCRSCAERGGNPPPPFGGESETAELPVSEPGIEAVLMERLRQDGRVETEELHMRAEDGTLVLEGALPSTRKQEILHSLLEENPDVEEIDDRLRIDPVPWERGDRPGRTVPSGKSDEEAILQGEGTKEGIFEGEDGESLVPADAMNPPDPREFGKKGS